jgi:hypothetical protein
LQLLAQRPTLGPLRVIMTVAMGIPRARKVLVILIGTLVTVGLCAYASFQLSPWPMVWLVRHSFDKRAKAVA